MNEVILVRALRLPLIAALAATMAIVLIAPIHRVPFVSPEDSSEVATEAPFESLPVISESVEEPSSVAQAAPAPPAGEVEAHPNSPLAPLEGALPRNASEANDGQTPEAAKGGGRPLLPTPTAPFHAMGKNLGRLNRQVNPVDRSVAKAASQLLAWFAHREPVTPEREQDSAAPSPLLRPVTSPRNNGDPAADSGAVGRIVLRNPEENGLPVVFLVNHRVETLSPGGELAVPDERATIRFDRGKSFGDTQLDLAPGVYDFAVSSEGWSLRRQEPSF